MMLLAGISGGLRAWNYISVSEVGAPITLTNHILPDIMCFH